MKLQTHGLSYFLGKIFLVMIILSICFIYEPTLSTLHIKKDKGTNYIRNWR